MEPALSRPGSSRLPLALLLAATALWGAWFVFRTSFLAAGQRVFCLFDDAMISMTYARNLVEGHGLNWARQGEPVEGFSHPLWTALMVPVNLLPLDLTVRSLVVQLLSLVLLLAHVVLVHRLVRRYFTTGRAPFALPAAVLTAGFYPLGYWSLMGMETALQALLVTGSVLLALDIVELGRDRHLALWGLATLAVLLRLDMVLPVAVVQAYVIARGGLRVGPPRRWPLRWLLGLGFCLAAALGYQAFRWLYFGDLLPNTYYLKLTGVPFDIRLLRGVATLAELVRGHLPLLLVVGVGLLPLLRGGGPERRWVPRLVLPGLLFAVACAYSVWVGGDVWELNESDNVRANRFIVYVMPLLFVLANGLLNLGLDALARRRPAAIAGIPGIPGIPGVAGVAGSNDPAGPGGSADGALLPRYLAASATVAALLTINGLWLSDRTARNWANLAVTERPLHVLSHIVVYGRLRVLQGVVARDAVVASVWAGLPAYFSDFRMVDLLGYNDRHIARMTSPVLFDGNLWSMYIPGHAKWDNEYVVRRWRPDAFFQTWGMEPGREARFLRRHGYRRRGGFWVRVEGGPPQRPAAARLRVPGAALPAPPAPLQPSGAPGGGLQIDSEPDARPARQPR
jgi:hypothetical protein